MPDEPVRLFIGPANFAGQGRLWAAAASEHLRGVAAVSCSCLGDGAFDFEVDYRVPRRTYLGSRAWQEEHLAYVSESFTHVLLEAARPLFGSLFDGKPVQELDELSRRGLAAAMIAHGSDVRQPDRHAEKHRWSPFREADWADIPVFRANVERFAAWYAEFQGPVFVSTPDLMDDLPAAQWCPVVVDPARWATVVAPLERTVPVIVHAPSRSRIKGSSLVDPVAQALHGRGEVEYRRLESVPSSGMPSAYGSADIVLDQFRLGSYGVAACEAMAAGRVVLGHVSGEVREYIERTVGLSLPIIEATPDTLESVVEQVIRDRDDARATAAAGPRFVQVVHAGGYSARVLGAWLGHRPV